VPTSENDPTRTSTVLKKAAAGHRLFRNWGATSGGRPRRSVELWNQSTQWEVAIDVPVKAGALRA
jgi:hypothetical protein